MGQNINVSINYDPEEISNRELSYLCAYGQQNLDLISQHSEKRGTDVSVTLNLLFCISNIIYLVKQHRSIS